MGRTNIRVALGAIGLSAAALLSACAGTGVEEKAAAKDAQARASRSAPSFVSLNPCADAMITEVADRDQILALSHFSSYPNSSSIDPKTAAKHAATGGTAEEVIALAPDIVLASVFIAPATERALLNAGIKIEKFGNPATFEESRDQLERTALISRQPYWSEQLSRNLKPPDPPSPSGLTALLWQPGQIVAGEGTLVAENLRWAGFESYAEARGLDQADYITLETILADPPDVLLIAGDARGQRHPLLAQLDNTYVAEFGPELFYCGGPVLEKARARLTEIRGEAESFLQ